ncbi:hypothetical protein HK104_007728, partial [Borealophlyctis nickersoniae]
MDLDVHQRFLTIVAGPHVLLYRFVTSVDMKRGLEEDGGTPMSPEEMDRVMKELDETVEEVLTLTKEYVEEHEQKDEASTKAEGGGEGGSPKVVGTDGVEGQQTQSPTTDVAPEPTDTPKSVPAAPASATPPATTPTNIPPRSSSAPQTPPRRTSTTIPPRSSSGPPRRTSTTKSPGSPSDAAPALPPRAPDLPPRASPPRSYTVMNKNVIVEQLGARKPPDAPGMHPVVQAIHMDVVVVEAVAGWADLMATSTASGQIHFIQISTGKVVHTDVIYEIPEDEPTTPRRSTFGWGSGGNDPREEEREVATVVVLHFADTVVPK